MSTNFHQRIGSEVAVGWTAFRAPLWMRGIRCADGGDGGDGGGGTPPVPTQPAPAPAPVPQPPKPLHPGYSEDYVKGLREEAKGYREAGDKTRAEAVALSTENETLKAQLASFEKAEAERVRVTAIKGAATGIADVDALLDSASFAKAIESVDTSDEKALASAVAEFVKENVRFAVTVEKQTRQHGAPAGGGQKAAPSGLESSISAAYANK